MIFLASKIFRLCTIFLIWLLGIYFIVGNVSAQTPPSSTIVNNILMNIDGKNYSVFYYVFEDGHTQVFSVKEVPLDYTLDSTNSITSLNNNINTDSFTGLPFDKNGNLAMPDYILQSLSVPDSSTTKIINGEIVNQGSYNWQWDPNFLNDIFPNTTNLSPDNLKNIITRGSYIDTVQDMFNKTLDVGLTTTSLQGEAFKRASNALRQGYGIDIKFEQIAPMHESAYEQAGYGTEIDSGAYTSFKRGDLFYSGKPMEIVFNSKYFDPGNNNSNILTILSHETRHVRDALLQTDIDPLLVATTFSGGEQGVKDYFNLMQLLSEYNAYQTQADLARKYNQPEEASFAQSVADSMKKTAEKKQEEIKTNIINNVANNVARFLSLGYSQIGFPSFNGIPSFSNATLSDSQSQTGSHYMTADQANYLIEEQIAQAIAASHSPDVIDDLSAGAFQEVTIAQAEAAAAQLAAEARLALTQDEITYRNEQEAAQRAQEQEAAAAEEYRSGAVIDAQGAAAAKAKAALQTGSAARTSGSGGGISSSPVSATTKSDDKYKGIDKGVGKEYAGEPCSNCSVDKDGNLVVTNPNTGEITKITPENKYTDHINPEDSSSPTYGDLQHQRDDSDKPDPGSSGGRENIQAE